MLTDPISYVANRKSHFSSQKAETIVRSGNRNSPMSGAGGGGDVDDLDEYDPTDAVISKPRAPPKDATHSAIHRETPYLHHHDTRGPQRPDPRADLRVDPRADVRPAPGLKFESRDGGVQHQLHGRQDPEARPSWNEPRQDSRRRPHSPDILPPDRWGAGEGEGLSAKRWRHEPDISDRRGDRGGVQHSDRGGPQHPERGPQHLERGPPFQAQPELLHPMNQQRFAPPASRFQRPPMRHQGPRPDHPEPHRHLLATSSHHMDNVRPPFPSGAPRGPDHRGPPPQHPEYRGPPQNFIGGPPRPQFQQRPRFQNFRR